MDNFALIFSLNLVAEHNVCLVLMLWIKNYIPNFGQVQSHIYKKYIIHSSFRKLKGKLGIFICKVTVQDRKSGSLFLAKARDFSLLQSVRPSLQPMKSIVQWILRQGPWR